MQLIESYLFEVGRYLPDDQRDDILGELRSSLEDEARELAGTDTPTREQIETVLNKYGHPINVASGYKEPRYLIGPELYPAFIETLSTIFTVSLIIVVSLQLLTWVTSGWATGAWGFAGNLMRLSLWLVALTVIIFATLEYYGERVGWYDNWKASSLSTTAPTSFDRSDIMTNLFSEGVFLLWWNNVLIVQNWIPGLADQFTVSLSEVWDPLLWPINIVVGLWFVVHAYTLLKRRWIRPALLGELVLCVLGIVLCAYLVIQPELITFNGEVEGFDLLERSLRISLLVIAGIIGWDLWQATKLWKQSNTK